MSKLRLLILCWFLVEAAIGNSVRADGQQGRLTQDITVGASHDIHLKANQAVQVMNHSGDAVVIMVALPDGSNGVYQVPSSAVEAQAQSGMEETTLGQTKVPVVPSSPDNSSASPPDNQSDNSLCARLGEREDEIISRRNPNPNFQTYQLYKSAEFALDADYLGNKLYVDTNCDRIDFDYSGFQVTVRCLNGISEMEEFSGTIAPQAVRVLLDANSQGHTWVQKEHSSSPYLRIWKEEYGTSVDIYGTYVRDDGAQALADGRTFKVITKRMLNTAIPAPSKDDADNLHWASLGASIAQLRQSYGQPDFEQDISAMNNHGIAVHEMAFQMMFNKSRVDYITSIDITAYLLNGVTVKEEIEEDEKQGHSYTMTDDERLKILKSISGGQAWSETRAEDGAFKSWVNGRGDIANWTSSGFVVSTKEYSDAINAGHYAEQHPKMQGF